MQQVDDDAVLKSFVDLCESSPKFLRPQIGGVIQLCLKVRLIVVCIFCSCEIPS